MSVALLPLRGSDCYLVRSDACPSFRFNSSLGRLPGLVNHRGSDGRIGDRKSTRLNSSHLVISYAVFCLKKTHVSDQTQLSQLTPIDAAQPRVHTARVLSGMDPIPANDGPQTLVAQSSITRH